LGSFETSWQPSPHAVWPLGQQMPLLHAAPPAQALPQPPQWPPFDDGSTHTPPQAISLEAQQRPAEQRPAQGLPHAPQLLRSDVRSTHAPPQFVWPVGQHFPDEHIAPGQSPSLQQSELAMQPTPHVLKPWSHWKPQAPAAHVGVPFVTDAQAVQRAPQEFTLVLERHSPPQSCVPPAQAPMQDCPSGMQTFAHSFLPGGQVAPQALPSQVAVPPWGVAHAEHEPPQVAGAVSSAHAPLHAW